jgi:hypothetical protein
MITTSVVDGDTVCNLTYEPTADAGRCVHSLLDLAVTETSSLSTFRLGNARGQVNAQTDRSVNRRQFRSAAIS